MSSMHPASGAPEPMERSNAASSVTVAKAVAVLVSLSLVFALSAGHETALAGDDAASTAADSDQCAPTEPRAPSICPFVANRARPGCSAPFSMRTPCGTVFITDDAEIVYALRGRLEDRKSVV